MPPRQNIETKIADSIKVMLEDHGWFVYNLHGNLYQQGMPDKLCLHPKYGSRFVEVKKPTGSRFTKYQKLIFPIFDLCKTGVWVLVAATKEEYKKLFSSPNWKEKLTKGETKWIKEKYPWFLGP